MMWMMMILRGSSSQHSTIAAPGHSIWAHRLYRGGGQSWWLSFLAVLYTLSLSPSFPPSISSLSIPSFIHPTVPRPAQVSSKIPLFVIGSEPYFLNYPSNVIIGLLLSYLRRILSGFNPTWPTNHVVVVGWPLMLCTTTPHARHSVLCLPTNYSRVVAAAAALLVPNRAALTWWHEFLHSIL